MNMSLYRDLFVSEARDHLSALNALIVRLEEFPGDKGAVDELFRHAHSLKGMAASMGYEQLASLAHSMEDQLSRVRSAELPFVPSLADLLLEGSDALAGMISQIEAEAETTCDAAGLVERLAAFQPPPEKTWTGERRRASDRDPGGQPSSPTVVHQFRQTDSFKSIRIKTETLDRLVTLADELISQHHRLADCVQRSGLADFDEPLNQLSGLLRDLQNEVFKARMVPFSFIAERFPRLVRDLARKQGKEINFQLDGKNIELDRGILEEIAEPLIHILRNAVDHGLEQPRERLAAGKAAVGDLRLSVMRDRDQLEIVITDDGRGMDPQLLKSKAVENGLISPEQAEGMTCQELFLLVCCPGFSTAKTVSEISGRGVGMDAVQSVVSSLGGLLAIDSAVGAGSRIVLRLPHGFDHPGPGGASNN